MSAKAYKSAASAEVAGLALQCPRPCPTVVVSFSVGRRLSLAVARGDPLHERQGEEHNRRRVGEELRLRRQVLPMQRGARLRGPSGQACGSAPHPVALGAQEATGHSVPRFPRPTAAAPLPARS